MAKEPRQSQRVNAEVPVRLEGNSGLTRDISPNGVYFVIGEKLEAGQQIHFSIEFDDPGGGVLYLDCIGKVVRVEETGGKSGVAATITQSRLERRASDAPPREETA